MTDPVTVRDLFRFTWHYWHKRLAMIVAAVVLIVICCAMQNVIMPLYVRRITDQVAVGTNDYVTLWHDFAIFASVSFAQSLIWTVVILIWNMFTCNMLYDVVGDGLAKVQRFSADWHANAFAGGTVRKITRGMGAFDVFSDRLVIGFFVIFVVMTITTFTLSVRMPWVGAFFAVMVILYATLSLYVSRRYLVPLYRRVASADTALGSTLADIITGIPTIKAFASEEREDEHFDKVRVEWRTHALRAWQVSRIIDAVRTVIRLCMLAGMVGITIYLWQQGRATAGDIALVLTCYFLTHHMLRDVGVFINDVQKAASEMEDIVSFWKRQDDVQDAKAAKALQIAPGGGSIEFEQVTFRYQNTNSPIYDGLSVHIRAGEKIALVGMSGSGKSTFVKLLQRLYDIQGGQIRIDGQDIAQVTQQSLRANIALVPQDPILFHRSLADNIAYGRPGASMAEIEAAARQAYAHDFIMSFPQGYDTLVGERGVKLSGGERQRVAVARAILSGAPILVLDEATSSLDSVSEYYIQQAMEHLTAGRTTITIAHRLATIRQADRILVFERGQIIERGRHDDLIANPESLYKRLYDKQALGLIDSH
jgi:ATP-binding cassette, subfamily B, bacterial